MAWQVNLFLLPSPRKDLKLRCLPFLLDISCHVSWNFLTLTNKCTHCAPLTNTVSSRREGMLCYYLILNLSKSLNTVFIFTTRISIAQELLQFLILKFGTD